MTHPVLDLSFVDSVLGEPDMAEYMTHPAAEEFEVTDPDQMFSGPKKDLLFKLAHAAHLSPKLITHPALAVKISNLLSAIPADRVSLTFRTWVRFTSVIHGWYFQFSDQCPDFLWTREYPTADKINLLKDVQTTEFDLVEVPPARLLADLAKSLNRPTCEHCRLTTHKLLETIVPFVDHDLVFLSPHDAVVVFEFISGHACKQPSDQ